MEIKNLIQHLSQFPPNSKIKFTCNIESGRSLSICNEGNLLIENDEEEDGVVVVNIWGEESDWN